MAAVAATYPHVRVRGAPRERGRAYGEQARDRVRRSVDGYRELFGALTGWGWERIRKEAARFEEPIAAFDEACAEELRGIAEGAAVDLVDVLALNVRTEIVYAAKARSALRAAGGCTALALLPEASAAGETIVAQNWDWYPHSLDTVVVLESQPDEAPAFVTVVEAGLLAKAGMNAAGLGLATNALATDADRGEPGVPYHVVLRAILGAQTISEALAVIQRGRRVVLGRLPAGARRRPRGVRRDGPRRLLGAQPPLPGRRRPRSLEPLRRAWPRREGRVAVGDARQPVPPRPDEPAPSPPRGRRGPAAAVRRPRERAERNLLPP